MQLGAARMEPEAILDVKAAVSFGWALKHKKIQPAAAHSGTSM